MPFAPTPTVESMGTMARKNINISREELSESRRIWTSFHFLPGNRSEDAPVKEYQGETSWLLRKIKDEELQDMRLVCFPNSSLAEDMVNDLVGKPVDCSSGTLHLLGLRMHALADTWAHQGFAGVNSYWFNEVEGKPTWVKSNEEIPFKVKVRMTAVEVGSPFLCTPPAPSFDSYSYAGHGRIGYVPDMPYACFRFHPHWSHGNIERNNPEEFMRAFLQMVKALMCVRQGRRFAARTYWNPSGLAARVVESVDVVLRRRLGLRSGEVC